MSGSINEGALCGADDAEHLLMLAAYGALTCSVQCTSCADAGVPEVMHLPAHLRDGPDIADVCEVTAWVATRQQTSSKAVLEGMLEACATACDARADFCDPYDHSHCHRSAQVARECARDCRAALAAL